MDYALTLAIDGHPPALNGEQGLIRLHYRSYAQKRTEWETLILAALPPDVRTFFQDHHFVECEVWYLHRNKKGLDWDNCAASFKVVSDALVNVGILQDDHPGVIRRFHVDQERCGAERPGIRVTIQGRVVPSR